MRRVLIIDDQHPAFVGDIEADAGDDSGDAPEWNHINPLDYVSRSATPEQAVSNLLAEIKVSASKFWDVIVIDLFLGDFGFSDHGNVEVCLRIAEAAREQNKSATILLYSGTLSKYVSQLLDGGASDTQLRRIFHAGVVNFFPRGRVAREVTSAFDNPSWLLRVDRLLMQHAARVIGPQESEFAGQHFGDLAMAVRRQDSKGQIISKLMTEYGIAALVDLN